MREIAACRSFRKETEARAIRTYRNLAKVVADNFCDKRSEIYLTAQMPCDIIIR